MDQWDTLGVFLAWDSRMLHPSHSLEVLTAVFLVASHFLPQGSPYLAKPLAPPSFNSKLLRLGFQCQSTFQSEQSSPARVATPLVCILTLSLFDLSLKMSGWDYCHYRSLLHNSSSSFFLFCPPTTLLLFCLLPVRARPLCRYFIQCALSGGSSVWGTRGDCVPTEWE